MPFYQNCHAILNPFVFTSSDFQDGVGWVGLPPTEAKQMCNDGPNLIRNYGLRSASTALDRRPPWPIGTKQLHAELSLDDASSVWLYPMNPWIAH